MERTFSACLILLLASPATAQCLVNSMTSGSNSGYFGAAISAAGGRVLIGNLLEGGSLPYSGSAHIFEYSSNNFTSMELVSPSPLANGYFGQAVALAGGQALIGSRDHEMGADAGAIFVYEQVGASWQVVQKLTASDGTAGDNFGVAIDVEDDRMVVGASGDQSGIGAAYIFERSGGVWQETKRLFPSSPEPFAFFGQTVAISGARALIGCTGTNPLAGDPGAAYVFEEVAGVWGQTDRLVPAGSTFDDLVGHALDLDGNRAVIGAPGSDLFSGNSGAAFVFELQGGEWNEVARLDGSVNSNAGFGLAISLVGNRVAISAPAVWPSSAVTFAEVFEGSGATWVSRGTVLGDNPAFGAGIELWDGALLAGPARDSGMDSVRQIVLEDQVHLVAGPSSVSVSNLGSQAMQVCACTSLAGAPYRVLGSMTGTGGFSPSGVHVPLTFDRYTRLLIGHPELTLRGGTGHLDSEGRALVRFQFSSPALAPLVGRTLHHAALIFAPGGAPFVASNPVALNITP